MSDRFISFNWSLNLDDPVEGLIHNILVDIENPRERREYIINAVLYYSRSPYLELVGGLRDLVSQMLDKAGKAGSLDKDLYIQFDSMSRKIDSFTEQVLLEVRSRDSLVAIPVKDDGAVLARLDIISKQLDSLSVKVSEQVVVDSTFIDAERVVVDDVESDGLDKLFIGMGDKFGVGGEGD